MSDFTLEHSSVAEEVNPRIGTSLDWFFTGGGGVSSTFNPVVGRTGVAGGDIIYADGDITFAGFVVVPDDTHDGHVQTWMSVDNVQVWPTYANARQHIGEDEWAYKGIAGNNQISTGGGGGGTSVRPASGFIYPRRI